LVNGLIPFRLIPNSIPQVIPQDIP